LEKVGNAHPTAERFGMNLQSNSVEQTIEIGRSIGRSLQGGEVIALIGQLGTGKTHLVKGIARGLEIDESAVNSPTFTLINEYEGRLPLYHIDAYRLDKPQQLAELGFDELCGTPNVTLVEWADLVWPTVEPLDPIIIRLDHAGPTARNITLSNILEQVQKALRIAQRDNK
jgi:tRNA threonylcarbamoyladenosine biosynthesis protein TsaE